MRTALDAPPELLDQVEQSFVAKVREHGWFRTGVRGDAEGPAFSFTTGFWLNTRTPEVIMFSMKDEIAHDVFWDLFRTRKAIEPCLSAHAQLRCSPISPHTPFLSQSVTMLTTSDGADGSTAATIFRACRSYGPIALERFPWEAGFDPAFANDQPNLTENGWLAALAN